MTADINNTSLPDTGVEKAIAAYIERKADALPERACARRGELRSLAADIRKMAPSTKPSTRGYRDLVETLDATVKLEAIGGGSSKYAQGRRHLASLLLPLTTALSARTSVAVAVGEREADAVERNGGEHSLEELLEIVASGLPAAEREIILTSAAKLRASLTAPVEETVDIDKIATSIDGLVRAWMEGPSPLDGEGLKRVITSRLKRFLAASTASPSIAGEEARERERCAKIARRLLEGYDTGDDGFGVEEAILSGRPAK